MSVWRGYDFQKDMLIWDYVMSCLYSIVRIVFFHFYGVQTKTIKGFLATKYYYQLSTTACTIQYHSMPEKFDSAISTDRTTIRCLEPVCPLFWELNPPKEGPFRSKQRSFLGSRKKDSFLHWSLLWIAGWLLVWNFRCAQRWHTAARGKTSWDAWPKIEQWTVFFWTYHPGKAICRSNRRI